jgi:SAM-dependent methyltransferase
VARRFRDGILQKRGPAFALQHRDISAESPPHGGGVEGFATSAAAEINRARLDHLGSLGLPFDGRRVLDVGGGVGHLAQFFVGRGCTVVSTDAREENVAEMHRIYPTLEGRVLDVERDDIGELGRFDIVFCYGLLYHLENPVLALRKLAGVCDDLMLLETMICDSPLPVMRLEDETLSATQALRGIAHRPSPSYLAMALDRIGFASVYIAAEPPKHPDYRFERRGDLAVARDGHLLRSVFVASKHALENDRLVPLID